MAIPGTKTLKSLALRIARQPPWNVNIFVLHFAVFFPCFFVTVAHAGITAGEKN